MSERRRTISEQLETPLNAALSWMMRGRSKSIEMDVVSSSPSSPKKVEDPVDEIWHSVDAEQLEKFSLKDVQKRAEKCAKLVARLKENMAKGAVLKAKIDDSIIPRLSRVPMKVSSSRRRLTGVEKSVEILKRVRNVVVDLQALRVCYDEEREPKILVDCLLDAESSCSLLERIGVGCGDVLGRETDWWREQIALALHVAWKKNFVISEEGDKDVSLKIGRPFDAPPSDFVYALKKLGLLEDSVGLLAREAEELLVGRMTTLEPKIVRLTEDPTVFTIEIMDKLKTSENFDFCAPLLPVVEAFEFLHRKLLSEEVCGENLAGFFGDMAVNFQRKLRDDILTSALPSDLEKLDAFSSGLKDFSQLEARLVKIGFLPRTMISQEVAQKVEFLFAEKRRHAVLEQARKIISRKILEVVEVGGDSGRSCVNERRKVSENASNLATLVLQVEEEANVASERGFSSVASILRRCAAREVLELYLRLTPVFHAQEAEKLPFVAAVLRNDAWFLADFSSVSRESFQTPDLDRKLRDCGSDFLEVQLKKQRGVVKEDLRHDGGFPANADEGKKDGVDKCVKMLMAQLTTLHGIWSPCLPYRVFCASMALLVDCACEEILRQILTCEDIASDAAAHFAEVLQNLFLERVPDLFHVDSEKLSSRKVFEFVPRLIVIRELVFVLEAHLADIRERWGGGNGPLAAAFASGQLKFLVRALFQNTDNRAKVLASIS